jgi:outer membrane protein
MRRPPLRTAFLAAALLLLAAAPALAETGFEVGARGIYWFPDLSGDAAYKNEASIDLDSTLGVDRKNQAGAEAFARILWFGARAGYMPLKFEGNATLAAPVTFRGTSFSGAVATDVDLKTADLEVNFTPLRLSIPWLANAYAGILVKGKLVDGSISLESPASTPSKVTEDVSGVVPMVGVTAGAGVLKDVVRVDARVAGIAYGGNHLYEGDAALSLSPRTILGVNFRLQGGYRIIDLDSEELGDVRAKLRIAGPYAGLQVDF